jgi:hypothetical protein
MWHRGGSVHHDVTSSWFCAAHERQNSWLRRSSRTGSPRWLNRMPAASPTRAGRDKLLQPGGRRLRSPGGVANQPSRLLI